MQPNQVVIRFTERAKEFTNENIETFAYIMGKVMGREDNERIEILGLWLPSQNGTSDMVSPLSLWVFISSRILHNILDR